MSAGRGRGVAEVRPSASPPPAPCGTERSFPRALCGYHSVAIGMRIVEGARSKVCQRRMKHENTEKTLLNNIDWVTLCGGSSVVRAAPPLCLSTVRALHTPWGSIPALAILLLRTLNPRFDASSLLPRGIPTLPTRTTRLQQWGKCCRANFRPPDRPCTRVT